MQWMQYYCILIRTNQTFAYCRQGGGEVQVRVRGREELKHQLGGEVRVRERKELRHWEGIEL